MAGGFDPEAFTTAFNIGSILATSGARISTRTVDTADTTTVDVGASRTVDVSTSRTL